MEDKELQRRIEVCRKDCTETSGKPCQYFLCPILLRDDSVEMCRGHMVAGGSNDKWVPQRKDVDNFFGSAVEAKLVTIVEDRLKDPMELLLDPSHGYKHKIRMELDGKVIPHYFPQANQQPVPGHTRLTIQDNKTGTIANVGVKVAPSTFLEGDNSKLELVVEGDFQPPVIAAILKAAHLSMFHLLGYDYVFSPGGQYLADILKIFFEKHQGSHSASEEAIARHFAPYRNMVAPLFVQNQDFLRGTAEDNMLLSCWTNKNKMFAIGVIAAVMQDRFCAFLPVDSAIDTYFSFIKEPPPFVTTRLTKFCDGSDGNGARWDMAEKTREIPLNVTMPVS